MRSLGRFEWSLLVAMSICPIAAHAFSDPTRPVDFIGARTRTVHSAPAAPVLQSTLVSPRRRLAVINGKQVRVGDRYHGAVITEISQSSVRMNKGGHEITLRLLPKFTKKIEAVK